MALPLFRDDGWLPEGHHPATWEEVERYFGAGRQRMALTQKLMMFRDELRVVGINGYFVLDGSYISNKPVPNDFDVLLVAAPGCQALKDRIPEVNHLLDTEYAEKQRGFSLLFIEETSSLLTMIKTVWDISKQGVPKGVIEVIV